MIVLSALSLLLWLIIVPFCMGLLICRILPPSKQTVGITFLAGYLLSFAVFEVVSIPCMISIQYNAFSTCCRIFTLVSGIMAVAGVAVSFNYVMKELKSVSYAHVQGAPFLKSVKEIGLLVFPGELHAGAEDMKLSGENK